MFQVPEESEEMEDYQTQIRVRFELVTIDIVSTFTICQRSPFHFHVANLLYKKNNYLKMNNTSWTHSKSKSKKSCPIFLVSSRNRNEQDFLDKQYTTSLPLLSSN